MKKVNYVCDLELKDLEVKLPCYGSVEEPLFWWKDVRDLEPSIKADSPSDFIKGIELESDESFAVILGSENFSEGKFKHGGLRKGTEIVVFNEDGLYEVLMSKPKLKQFRKPIKSILKEIRLKGGYISDSATMEQVEELVKAYSFRSITQQISDCEILKLQELVESILEANSNISKKDRDEYHKGMNKTEYKQHLREHIRKAVINRSYNDKGVDSAIETAIRYKIIEQLDRELLTTHKKSSSQKIKHLKKDKASFMLNAVELVDAMSQEIVKSRTERVVG